MGFECFLCLDLNKEYANCIKIDTWKWNGQDIKSLIEKHLWQMDLFKSTSKWLCSACWNLLKDFHKFYIRIEDFHLNDTNLVKLHIEATYEQDTLNDVLPEAQLTDTHSLHEETVYVEDENDIDLSQEILVSFEPHTLDFEEVHTVSISEQDEFNEDEIIVYLSEDQNEPEIVSDEIVSEIVHPPPLPTKPKEQNPVEKLPCKENKPKRRQARDRLALSNTILKSHEHNQFLAKHFKISCDICRTDLESFPRLLKHFAEKHIGTKAYTICCGRKFFSRAALVSHIHSHLDPDYFKCKKCSKILKNHQSLLNHMAWHEGKLYRCRVCNRKFLDKSKLEKHILKHGSEEKLTCPDCGKTYAHKSGLAHHQRRIHMNKYIKLCSICGMSMRDLDTFKRHMAKHEGKPSPTSHACDICGIVLSRKQCVKIHKELKHPQADNPIYKCDICTKYTTTSRSQLKDHIRLTHTAERKHKCTICEKTYKDPKKLKEHVALHTGEPIYTCAWCPQTFFSSGNLSSHRRRYHPKEWEEALSKKYAFQLPQNITNQDV